MACFHGWVATLGRAGRRAEVAMERDTVRGIAREMVRRDNIMMIDYPKIGGNSELKMRRKKVNELR